MVMNTTTKALMLASPALIGAALLVVLSTTSPSSVGAVGVLGVFLLIYAFALSSLFVVLHFGINWLSRLTIAKQDSIRHHEVTVGARKAYYIASSVAFVPVLFLAMRSFAELRLTDIVLVGVFVLIAVFYIVKRS